MAKQVAAKLAAGIWNWLFQKISIFELPAKVGDASYDFVQQRMVKDECNKASAELKAYSPWAQKLGEEMRLVFGPVDMFDQVRKDGKLEELILREPERILEVRLSEDAVSGIAWMLLTMLSPATKDEKTGKKTHEELLPFSAATYAWPVAMAIRKVAVLRAALNLDASDKKRKWADDPEPEAVVTEVKA